MKTGRVKSDTGLNLRAKPNGEKVGVLGHNQHFSILDEVSFYRVRTATGKVGYVHADYVETIVSDEVFAPPSNEWNAHFQLTSFAHPHFTGTEAKIDVDFVPALTRIGDFAQQCDVSIWVTSSIRALNNQIDGAIVTPATNSCHHVGHAIDMNVMHAQHLYNSTKLRRSNHSNLPDAVRAFLELVRNDDTLRWGGDFAIQDPVHIDDNLFNIDRLQYRAKLSSRVQSLNV